MEMEQFANKMAKNMKVVNFLFLIPFLSPPFVPFSEQSPITGNWVNGKREGQGDFVSGTGNKFKGSFVNNMVFSLSSFSLFFFFPFQ